MTLGPVFIIHSGSAQQRAEVGQNLAEQWQKAFPFWTETCDTKNGNVVLVFASNQTDAWSVKVADAYDALKSDGVPPLNIYDIDVGAKDGNHEIHTEEANPSITAGFSRYP